MAAPKKCKSLIQRRMETGRRIRSGVSGFVGLSVRINNIYNCKICNKNIISHRYCHKCNMEEIKNILKNQI